MLKPWIPLVIAGSVVGTRAHEPGPTIWKGTVEFKNGGVAGSASTAFTFDDMHMEQPRVPVLLSVADTIKLEIDFNLIQQK